MDLIRKQWFFWGLFQKARFGKIPFFLILIQGFDRIQNSSCSVRRKKREHIRFTHGRSVSGALIVSVSHLSEAYNIVNKIYHHAHFILKWIVHLDKYDKSTEPSIHRWFFSGNAFALFFCCTNEKSFALWHFWLNIRRIRLSFLSVNLESIKQNHPGPLSGTESLLSSFPLLSVTLIRSAVSCSSRKT